MARDWSRGKLRPDARALDRAARAASGPRWAVQRDIILVGRESWRNCRQCLSTTPCTAPGGVIVTGKSALGGEPVPEKNKGTVPGTVPSSRDVRLKRTQFLCLPACQRCHAARTSAHLSLPESQASSDRFGAGRRNDRLPKGRSKIERESRFRARHPAGPASFTALRPQVLVVRRRILSINLHAANLLF